MIESLAIKNKLKLALSLELPGMKSHLKLAPIERIEDIQKQKSSKDAKPCAVLIVLFKENEKLKLYLSLGVFMRSYIVVRFLFREAKKIK